ncbi:MAG TPA: hypothetical protein VMB50_03635 [Myxococcales bacterium]|nr:hypothetical protein [Myxococcales bacterium]
MGGPLLLSAVLLRVLPGQVPDATAQQEAKLAAAVRAVNNLNDERARVLLDDLLASVPPDRIAAQAYMYLGVMDFNALDQVHAHEELRRALELDPTIEVPPTTSPKIALAFEELRRKLAQKLRAEDQPAPASAVAAPPIVVEKEAPRSRVWPWVLGAAAVVAAGVSAWGWVEVASFEQLKSSSSGANPVTPEQAQSSHDSAAIGEPVGIVGAIAAAGFLTGTVLTW